MSPSDICAGGSTWRRKDELIHGRVDMEARGSSHNMPNMGRATERDVIGGKAECSVLDVTKGRKTVSRLRAKAENIP